MPFIWYSSSTICSIKVVSWKRKNVQIDLNNSLSSIEQIPKIYGSKYEMTWARTWKPSFTVSNCRIGSAVGRCHLLGSHRMVLLKAKPDISTWNLRSLLLFSFVCHPITWLPLHTGPSRIALFLLWASMPTGQVPKRLYRTEMRWIEKS